MSELSSSLFGLPASDSNGSGEETSRRERCDVLGSPIDVVGWAEAVDRIAAWARMRQKRLVVICNVHSIMTAMYDPLFASIIERADLATPDGMPIAWRLRRRGYKSQQRIDGPGLMLLCCAQAAMDGTPIFLLGSTEQALSRLQERLLNDYPGLQIAGALSPPFSRKLAQMQEPQTLESIRQSGAGILFVGLGCPKQEQWMARNAESLNLVMIGVGAAFDFHAGIVRRAPLWMRNRGLEWLHRLTQDPRRLWRRYLKTNSHFIYEVVHQRLQRSREARRLIATRRSGQ